MLRRIRRGTIPVLGGCLLAAAGLASVQAVPARASAPSVQVCAPNDDGGWCMNRDGGGTGQGTQVISWTLGDSNNEFTWFGLPDYCGGGHVTPTCPAWGNTAVNRAHDGAAIGEIESVTAGLCLGLNGQLTGCGDEFTGAGAGTGTIQVFTACGSVAGGACGASPDLNSYWTGQHKEAEWVKVPLLAGQPIVMGTSGAPVLTLIYTE
jgi:hypothetical protein